MAYYKSGQIYATQNSNVAIQTASGSIASFETPLQMPVFGLKADIVPVQSGSGTPSPSNSRAISGRMQVLVTKTGKNLLGGSKLLANAQEYITSGTTDTENKTFSYGVNAGVTDGLSFSSGIKFKEDTRYTIILSLSKTSNSNANVRVIYTDGSNYTIGGVTDFNIKTTILYKTSSSKTIDRIVKNSSGGTTTLYYDECAVIEGVLTAEDFEAYKGETKTISLGQTVYGGTLDLLTGKLISNVVIASYDGSEDWKTNSSNGVWLDVKSGNYLEAVCSNIFEALPNGGSNAMSNNQLRLNASGTNLLIKCPDAMTADDFKTFLQTHPLQVAYRVASTETNLTPETFKTFVGTNNFYADCGDVEVKYKNVITGG